MMEKKIVMWCAVAVIAGVFIGYAIGQSLGYKKGDSVGYERARADIQKTEELALEKAAGEAARAANPFQASNPLEGVSANPFDKVKKVLNPFE